MVLGVVLVVGGCDVWSGVGGCGVGGGVEVGGADMVVFGGM